MAAERDWIKLDQQDADRDWLRLDQQPCARCLELEVEIERLRAELWAVTERANRRISRMFREIFLLEWELLKRTNPQKKGKVDPRTEQRRRKNPPDSLDCLLRMFKGEKGKKFKPKFLRNACPQKKWVRHMHLS